MAITVAAATKTQNRLTFLCTHDGSAGDTATIAAATMIAAASPDMAAFLGITWAGNNQANARKQLLGDNTATASTLWDEPHCRVFVRHRSGAFTGLTAVDADVDGVTPTQNELNITTSGGVAGTFYVDVEFQHSITR